MLVKQGIIGNILLKSGQNVWCRRATSTKTRIETEHSVGLNYNLLTSESSNYRYGSKRTQVKAYLFISSWTFYDIACYYSPHQKENQRRSAVLF